MSYLTYRKGNCMKILAILGVLISLNAFAQENSSSEPVFQYDPNAPVINLFDYGDLHPTSDIVNGKAKVVDVNPKWKEKKITRIVIDGVAGKKLYDDLESKEVDPKAPGYKIKQKQSKDGNIKCEKSETGTVCNVYINSKTGEGAYKVITEKESTPCEAVSDKSRDDFKEIHKKIKADKPSKKSSQQ